MLAFVLFSISLSLPACPPAADTCSLRDVISWHLRSSRKWCLTLTRATSTSSSPRNRCSSPRPNRATPRTSLHRSCPTSSRSRTEHAACSARPWRPTVTWAVTWACSTDVYKQTHERIHREVTSLFVCVRTCVNIVSTVCVRPMWSYTIVECVHVKYTR